MSTESEIKQKLPQDSTDNMSKYEKTHSKKDTFSALMTNIQTIHMFQKICRAILIATGISFIFLFHKLYLYQQKLHGQDKELEYVYDFLTHGMLYGVIYTLFDFLCHHYLQDYIIKYYIDRSKYDSQEAMEKRAYSLVKWLYSILFYSSCSVANIVLFSGTSYAPSWLGGKDGFQLTDSYFLDFGEAYYSIKLLYMIEFGKHFSRLIIHSFIRQEGNYFEFTLHHMLSVALIVFSYLSNQWLAGMVVLFTHDLSDALLLIARFYKEYRNHSKPVFGVFAVLGVLSWAGLRGVAFPLYLVWPVFDRFILFMPTQSNETYQIVFWPAAYISLMLCVLQVMDYVWIYGLCKGVYNMTQSSKKKSEESGANPSNHDSSNHEKKE